MKKRTVLIFIFAAGFLLAEIPGNILYQSRRTLLETYDLIVGNYADSIDADNLMRSAIKGMTDELDPYTFYLRNDEKFNYQVLTSGHYGGVGMTITSHDDTISVVSVTAGSPISETDILPGDKLISIDGDTVTGYSVSKTALRLRGRPRSFVRLSFLRRPGQILNYRVQRRRVMVQPLTYYGEVSPGVMYYHLNRFSKGVSEILREKIEIALLQQDLETVILDCRDNGGGMLTEAVGVINCFLPQGSRVLETRSVHKDKNRVFVCSDRNLLPDSVKLIILINGHSASASEITAGVIQDYDRGVIAGTASHGKGLVQNIVDLSNEDSFKITTSKYYIPSGRLIQTPSYLNESTVISSHFDSMTVFYTKGGRIVTENGGISPDTVLKASEGIMLLRDIEKKNLFFKFIRHEAVYNTDTLRWSEPETLYADFCSFLDEKKYEYKCPFAEEIRSLKNKLEKMDCLGAVSRADLNYLEQKVLEKDKIDNYKIRIIEKLYIEKEEFYGGRSAGLRQSLYSDSILLNAIRLSQSPEYKHLLQAGNRQK